MSRRIIRASKEESKAVGHFKFNSAYPTAAAAKPAEDPAQQKIEAAEATVAPEARVETSDPPTWADQISQLSPASTEQQCELMIRQARQKVSEIEKEAYEIGFAEGQKAGGEVGDRMAESMLKQYSASFEEINKLRREVLASAEREVIRLALEIAKKVIKREVTIDDELILTLVKVTLNRVAGETLITIRVNPTDYQTIKRQHASRSSSPLNEAVKLVEDSQIGRGGCVIETESGTIDARIEEQLREIEKGFFE